jgi:hypothetical protein
MTHSVQLRGKIRNKKQLFSGAEGALARGPTRGESSAATAAEGAMGCGVEARASAAEASNARIWARWLLLVSAPLTQAWQWA